MGAAHPGGVLTTDTPFCVADSATAPKQLMCRGGDRTEALETLAAANIMCGSGLVTCGAAFTGAALPTTLGKAIPIAAATAKGLAPVLAESTKYFDVSSAAATAAVDLHSMGKNTGYTCGTTAKPGTVLLSAVDGSSFCTVPWVKPAK
jgi:hypothetical protein